MSKTSTIRCAACASPTAILASTRIEYRTVAGETYVDEVETDARRCTNAACPYAFCDLAEQTRSAQFVC